jgi:hypothetical protein
MMIEGPCTYVYIQHNNNTKNVTLRSKRPKGKEGSYPMITLSTPLHSTLGAVCAPEGQSAYRYSTEATRHRTGRAACSASRSILYSTVPATVTPSRQKFLPQSVSLRRRGTAVADLYYRESGGGAGEHNRYLLGQFPGPVLASPFPGGEQMRRRQY